MISADIFLDARCNLAMAQVAYCIDSSWSYENSNNVAAVFKRVVELARNSHSPHVPWPLKDVPALKFAFEEGYSLGERLRILQKRDRETLLRTEQYNFARSNAPQAVECPCFDASPTAVELLKLLQDGKSVELWNHTLSWDDDYAGLVGTNPYGMDYYWGSSTLEAVENWCAAVRNGSEIGRSPPTAIEEECSEVWDKYAEYCDGDPEELIWYSAYLLFTDTTKAGSIMNITDERPLVARA
uniref:hypothetical protein n=1 Tax=Acidovorax sp. SUPP3334 TaxID=2920881 RepID=UPI00295294AA|nr:hypothetical protein [Acidovorax sp. SUPP3334]BDH38348.1 hypothetical protein AVHM3334_23115 [Acidovorax sp. SUPP3334]